jgi:23S rRNA (uracil1939-C5)-methyltransferase
MEPAAQVRAKQGIVLGTLARLGKVEPERVLAPLAASPWGYRRRARLGARLVHKKGRVLVGFRERAGRYIADLASCRVLDPRAGALVQPLAALIGALSIPDRVPQVEVACGDALTVFVLRHLAPLTDADRAALRAFGRAHAVEWWLQPGDESTAAPLDPGPDGGGSPLRYGLHADDPAHAVEVEFRPTDFIQVNAAVNRLMVDQALELLAPRAGEEVLDLFCGLGNFTLPLARRGATVTGVEGDAGLVARARANAARQGIAVGFHVADLFQPLDDFPWARQRYDAVLLDPPRAGAWEAVQRMPRFAPERIVYVSCHPGTLARDAEHLVHQQGYRLAAAGAMDMFSHTAHVEAMALFVRGSGRKGGR